MHYMDWLQLFADGAAGDGGAGAGAGAAEAGETPAAAGQDRAEALGIPKALRETFAKANRGNQLKQQAAGAQQPAAEQNPPEQKQVTENQTEEQKKSLKEILASDKDLNAEMQNMIKDILRSRGKDMQARLDAANNAIAAVAPRYDISVADMDNFDYGALEKAAREDKSIWAQKAADMGVSEEQAQALEEAKILRQRNEAAMKKAEMQRQFQEHLNTLRAQGSEVERDFPGQFNFDQAMNDPEFRKMTAPGGVSVRQAFMALHGEELMSAASQKVAQGVQQKMAAAVASQAQRPVENGAQTQNAQIQRFDYSRMTKEQKAEFIRQAESAWKRGEKTYLR